MDDQERLEEWTIQQAAGADPLTAWAALPRDDKPRAPNMIVFWIVFLGLIALGWLIFK